MRVLATIALLLVTNTASALDVTQPPYNVVCDGTTDNTAGLQAALDSFCPTGQGEIELPQTGICKIASTIKARCLQGLTITGNANAPDASKPVIHYTGTGPRGIDLRGMVNFRSVGVAYEATNSYDGSLIDLRATKTCTNNGLRACDVDADCPGSTCNQAVDRWVSNAYFDLGKFSGPCADVAECTAAGAPYTCCTGSGVGACDLRLLAVRHIVNLNLDRNVFRGGMYHVYGVDNDNEWTSVVNLTRNYFYKAGRTSVMNLRWATNSQGNFWQPQGCNQNKSRAFDRSSGVTVEGFYSHGDSFWDLAPSAGYTETGPWISVSGRNINISSRFESAYTNGNCSSSGVPWACCTGSGTGTCTPIGQAVQLSGGASNGVAITGSYCKNLATCWNLSSKAHKNVSITGNGATGATTVVGGNTLTGCSISTANTLVCD